MASSPHAASLLLALLLLLLLGEAPVDAIPVVGTDDGFITGRTLMSAGEAAHLNGVKREFAAFYGIPYAQPPVGPLRFKPPVPVPLISGTFNATTEVPLCMQGRRHEGVMGSEDCLKLSIYTPNYVGSSMPVVVVVHGGAFMYSAGGRQGMDFIMDYDVVVVQMEYRLGILGFMSLEDEHLPGNLGLLDQLEAIRWVKENIHHFGGNSSQITLAGNSAGSVSVLLHSMSPLSQGLFRGVIGESGSPLNPWGQQHEAKARAMKVAAVANCSFPTSPEILECLRTKKAEDFVTMVATHFQDWQENPFSPFAPVVDSKAGRKAFMPEKPCDLLKRGRTQPVPMLLSVTKDEGLYPAAEFMTNPADLGVLNKRWNELSPKILHFEDRVPEKEMESVTNKIRMHYFNDSAINDATSRALVKMFSQRLFSMGVADHARWQASRSSQPVFLYHFEYRGQYSLSDMLSGTSRNLGVCHADDWQYLFVAPWSKISSTRDKQMRQRFFDMWISFVREGTPTIPSVTWAPVEKKAENYTVNFLRISGPEPQNMTMAQEKDLGDATFWNSLNLGDKCSGAAVHLSSWIVTVCLACLMFLRH